MGGGLSVPVFDELTQNEKGQLSRSLQEKYKVLKTEACHDDSALFHVLADYLSNESTKIINLRAATSTSTENFCLNVTTSSDNGISDQKMLVFPQLSLSIVASESPPGPYENFNGIDDIVGAAVIVEESESELPSPPTTKSPKLYRRTSFGIDTSFSPADAIINSKTSSELLSLAAADAATDQDKISSFILQMKSGDIITQSASEFRARRLTYASKLNSRDSAKDKTSTSSRNDTFVRKRTSIFASSEMGVRQESTPPFSSDIMGTYSCHGIEPSHDEDGKIHQKINQDRGCIVYPFNNSKTEALFLVLDGHGEKGDKISDFVMKQIIISLEKSITTKDPVTILKETFVKTNAALMVTNIDYMTSGCTCVAVYVVGKHLYVANAGDSRAVLATRTGDGRVVARDLSVDHKPDEPEESERITQWGGFVRPSPEPGLSARVYLDAEFTMIGLAMSRSIGDYAVKAVGVIAEPDVQEFDIDPQDQFMILASDGVWEFITSQEAVDIVQENISNGALEACRELIDTAASRWEEEEGDYRDDITAIVIRLPLPFQSSENSPGKS